MFTSLRKADPNQARVTITDIVEKIEVTAFPIMKSSLVRKEVLGKYDPMLRFDLRRGLGLPVSEEELFVPSEAGEEFSLAVGCSAFYIAEGKLNFPEVSIPELPVKFGLSPDPVDNNWWFLSIMSPYSFHGYSGQEVVAKLFEGMLKSKSPQFYELVADNIMLQFLGPKDSNGGLLRKGQIDNLIAKGEEAAKGSYRGILEEKLRLGIFDKIEPKTFTYELLEYSDVKAV
jgi:hypothetical protein